MGEVGDALTARGIALMLGERPMWWSPEKDAGTKAEPSLGGATLMTHAKFEVIAKLIWCTCDLGIKVVFRDGRRLAHLMGQVVRHVRHGARRAGARAQCPALLQRQSHNPRPAGSQPAESGSAP